MKTRTRRAVVVAAIIATVVFQIARAARKSSADPPSNPPEITTGEPIPGEVLVGLSTEDFDADTIVGAISSVGTAVTESNLGVIGAIRIKLAPGVSVAEAITRLSKIPGIEYAEPNHIESALQTPTPNDKLWPKQYGPKIIQAPQAWSIWAPQRTAVLAVVDSGVDGAHPDLTSKMLRDRNGNIIGYNALSGKPGPAKDDYGHGTHVSGIACAQVNNGAGVAGISGWPMASGTDTTHTLIMPVKVLDQYGNGLDSAVADGITAAAHEGANVINLSLGSPSYSETVQRAITYAFTTQHCIVVAAAGNNGENARNTYPAADKYVLTVGATDSTDTLTSYSNYGSCVAVTAPGDNVISTLPTYDCTMSRMGYPHNYGYLSGTSMATPHVAGLAALLWSQNASASNSQVIAWLVGNTDKYKHLDGRQTANGRINAYRAVAAATP